MSVTSTTAETFSKHWTRHLNAADTTNGGTRRRRNSVQTQNCICKYMDILLRRTSNLSHTPRSSSRRYSRRGMLSQRLYQYHGILANRKIKNSSARQDAHHHHSLGQEDRRGRNKTTQMTLKSQVGLPRITTVFLGPRSKLNISTQMMPRNSKRALQFSIQTVCQKRLHHTFQKRMAKSSASTDE